MTGRSLSRRRLRRKRIVCVLGIAIALFLIFTFWPRDLVRTIDSTVDRDSVSKITLQIFFPGPEMKEWSIEDESLIKDLFITTLKGQSMRAEVFTPGMRHGKVNRDPSEPRSVKILAYHEGNHGRELTRISVFDGRTSESVEINDDSYVLYGDGSELILALLDYAKSIEDE